VRNDALGFSHYQPLKGTIIRLICRFALLAPHIRKIVKNATSHFSVQGLRQTLPLATCQLDLPNAEFPKSDLYANAHLVCQLGLQQRDMNSEKTVLIASGLVQLVVRDNEMSQADAHLLRAVNSHEIFPNPRVGRKSQ